MHRLRTLAAAPLAALLLAAPASAQSPDLVVSQVYGGGGNSGAPYTHDFVELYNRGTTDVGLGGKSIQYASATGTGNFGASSTQLTELPDVTLGPGQYFLVQQAGGAAGSPLPESDFTDPTPIAMGATGGKIALARGAETLGCNGGGTQTCTPDQRARIIDLVGYGNANFFEGAGPAPAPSNSTAVLRAGSGAVDTDNNAADFTAGPPNPRGGGGTDPDEDDAPAVASSDPADGDRDVPLDGNVEVTFTEPVNAPVSAFSLQCSASGAHAVAVTGGPTTFTVDPAADFVRGDRCTLTIDGDGVSDQDTDDPPNTMAADETIGFIALGLALRIHDIQGDRHLSAYDGQAVSGVPGVVTARRSNGFYLQDPNPDADEETSEGIFVFTGGAPPASAAVDAAVLVSGDVQEFRAAATNLSLTEIVDPEVTPAGTGSIAPTIVGRGGRIPPNRIIDNDSFGDVDLNPLFDPRQDGIDFHESLEGMLVQINDAVAVGPTNGFGETAVVGDGGRYAGPRTRRGGIVITPSDFNPERLILDDVISRAPGANTGDTFSAPIRAVVDYGFGNFKYLHLQTPARVDEGLEREVTEAPRRHQLSVGSFNVENLRPADSPAKFAALADTLVTHMQSPDIVAVEEIQDNTGPTNDGTTDASLTWGALIAAVEAAGGPTYEYRQIDPVNNQDGGQPGGNIRVGFLFRTDRGLEFVDRPGGTSTNATRVVDTRRGAQLSYSPGRIEPGDPAWTASRKPLAGEFRWRGRTVFAIANHFASKGGDDPLFGRIQPPVRHTENGPDGRHRQAEVVHEFVEDLLAADKRARVIVLGDLNDFEFSETLEILEGDGELFNLMELLPKSERYSYVFDGNSQVLDQILASRSLMSPRPEYDSVHINAEFAQQTSDHDPQVARFKVTGRPSGKGRGHGHGKGRGHDRDDD